MFHRQRIRNEGIEAIHGKHNGTHQHVGEQDHSGRKDEELQAATLNPAQYLEREQELGTVEKGKLADLVLLDKNPVEDIRNTTSISAVVLDGKLMEKQTLDRAVQTYPVIKVADLKDEPEESKPSVQ